MNITKNHTKMGQHYTNNNNINTSGAPTSSVGRELSIASEFVKQYYTLLNKAPCFIYNFYSQDSTFIHGTIEMGNDNYTEPVVGREEIKRKMEDLKLNDCRAKIQQIDCLETLASGLVIQVIGDLSNNGKPMRRFLQTFVLAPSPDESASRQEQLRDSSGSTMNHNSKSGQPTSTTGPSTDNEASLSSKSSSNNQKFFVLNSIFRYQDNGTENEFDDETAASPQANMSVESSVSSGREMTITNKMDIVTKPNQRSNGPPPQAQQPSQAQDGTQQRRRQLNMTASVPNQDGDDVDRSIANNIDVRAKLSENKHQAKESEDTKQIQAGGSLTSGIAAINLGDAVSGSVNNSVNVVVLNGTSSSTEKKIETSDKSTENGKLNVDHSQVAFDNTIGDHGSQATENQLAQPVTSRPQPTNEPKTWANAVRNAHAAVSTQANVNKQQPTSDDQQAQQETTTHTSQPVFATQARQQRGKRRAVRHTAQQVRKHGTIK